MSSITDITEDDLFSQITDEPLDKLMADYQSEALSSIMLVSLYEKHNDDLKTALFLTNYVNTPSRVLLQISKEWSDEPVLNALASHQRTQPEVLQQLSVSEFISVRKSVACNKSLTPQTAAILVHDKNCVVRSMVAENVAQFPTTQLQLASDPHSCVVTSLVAHKKCGDQARKLIFEHESKFVKMSLAAVVSISNDKLLELADSNDENAQNALFLRSNLSEEIEESLCFSDHKQIALKAIKAKHLSDDELLGWAKHDDSDYRSLIATRNALPDLIQEVLAEDSSPNVLTALAGSRSLCERAANMVVENCADEEVITALASNPAISSDVVTKLCLIDDQTVHQLLALRKDLTDDHLDIMINEMRATDIVYTLAMRNVGFTNISKEITRVLVSSELPTIRAYGSNSKTLDQKDIPRLAYDPYPLVRENLIKNDNTSEATLEFLTTDKDEYIAALATEELKRRELLNLEEDNDEPGLLTKVLQVLKG